MNENVNVIIKARDEATKKMQAFGKNTNAMFKSISSGSSLVGSALTGAFAALTVQKISHLTGNLLNSYRDMTENSKKLSGHMENMPSHKLQMAAIAIKNMDVATKNMKISFMELIAPVITRFSGWLVDFSNRFQEMMENMKLIGIYVAENFTTMADVIAANAHLTFTYIYEEMNHLFTKRLPPLWAWFKENWKWLWIDIVSITVNASRNLYHNFLVGMQEIQNVLGWAGKNMGEAFVASFNLATTGQWKAQWTAFSDYAIHYGTKPLLDGFQSTMNSLPEIAARNLSDFERSLMSVKDSLGAQLKINFGQTVGTTPGGTSAPAYNPLGNPFATSRMNLQLPEARFLGTVAAGNTPADKTAANTARMANGTDKIIRVLEQSQKLLERLGGQAVINPPLPIVSIIK